MNKQKLIGSIIGVTLFALLVAGATFAWLSVGANITNSVYNGTTKNFIINYTGGTDITNVLQLSASNATTANITSGYTSVTASKSANSAPASSFKINFNISTNTFTTNSVIYAVCRGSCPTTTLATVSTNSGIATATCSNNGNVVACGTITGGVTTSTTPLTLYEDTTTFNTEAQVSDTTYSIYFWISSETLTNTDMNANASISGNISASAVQTG